ncbi:CPBP family intramembrane glutamic endopeptidase [Oceanobacillus neutriphilus]|uniref:CAAX amino protease n=1 Tax=Oceanobacillus neutriphilus TaxID=531815 RepID=A0ABQ2NP10_9BACI|nr:type II CAAX endopeptidase family protein [Oceanobacillus neutriphilus]GGP08187.1 CAAX amino protease [Oceanobacillus neutriphilus]
MEKEQQKSFIYCTLLLVIITILFIIFRDLFDVIILSYISDSMVVGVFFALIFLLLRKNRAFFFEKLTFDFFKNINNYIYVFIGYLLAVACSGAVSYLSISSQNSGTEIIQITSIPLIILLIIVAGIFVPIYEELLMKRVILDFSRSYLPFWMGMLITSLIFTLLHNVPLPQRIFIFMFSVITCIVYRKTDSLYGPILIHSLWNFTSLA